jgi:hypothetical protein
VEKKGNVLLIVTGECGLVDTFTSSKDVEDKEHLSAELNVFPEAIYFADSRQAMSRKNKIFAWKVYDAIKNGKDVILVAPWETAIDKRIRDMATIIKVPQKNKANAHSSNNS